MAVAEDFHLDFPIDIVACPTTYRTVFILLQSLLYHKIADNAIAKPAVFKNYNAVIFTRYVSKSFISTRQENFSAVKYSVFVSVPSWLSSIR